MSDAAAKENTHLSQRPNKIEPFHNQSSYTDVLSKLCSSLLETVAVQKVIQDRYLLDFSRLTVQIISNAIEILPNSFYELLSAFLQYLRNSAWNDTNQNRKSSYIRAHQIASMLDVYRTEQKHEELVRRELQTNQQNRDVLCYVFQSPGVAFSELQEKLKFSCSDLNKCIRELEEKKLLSSHRTEYDDEPYYMLSRLGRDLCLDLLAPRMHHVMPNQWSYERVCLLYLLLGTQLESFDDTIPVMTYIRKVSELREDDVQYFVSSMKKHVKKHPLGNSLGVTTWKFSTDYHKIHSAPQSILSYQFDSEPEEEYPDERYVGSKENHTASEDQMATKKYSTNLRMRRRIPNY